MKVRAKFKCDSVEDSGYGGERVTFTPVFGTDQNPANAEWSKYTPNGNISMHITAQGAVGQFQKGGEYFVDFTPAEEA